jgi:histidyl-tRNA synthetase
VEVLGSSSPVTDAETIILAKTFLDKLGAKNIALNLNSIGCADCRKKYGEALKKYLSDNFNELCPLCKERFAKNPMRVLDCKNPDCKKLTENAPKILDYICEDCSEHFNAVQNLLTTAGVEFKINPSIVRGLDYYTKTVFEFVSENIGAQGTVCGGGRYDKLVSEFGGPDVPGIGFATGIERLILLLENSGVEIPNDNKVKIYIAPMGKDETIKAFELTAKLRKEGVSAETDHMSRGIKAQFKYADKIGASFVCVIGSNELALGEAKVKDMKDGKEESVTFSDLIEYIKKK